MFRYKTWRNSIFSLSTLVFVAFFIKLLAPGVSAAPVCDTIDMCLGTPGDCKLSYSDPSGAEGRFCTTNNCGDGSPGWVTGFFWDYSAEKAAKASCGEGSYTIKASNGGCGGFNLSGGVYTSCFSGSQNTDWTKLDCANPSWCYKCNPKCECPAGTSETPTCTNPNERSTLQPAPSCDPNKKCYKCEPISSFKYCDHSSCGIKTTPAGQFSTAAQCTAAAGGATCYDASTPDATIMANDSFCSIKTCPIANPDFDLICTDVNDCNVKYSKGNIHNGKEISESKVYPSKGMCQFKACGKTSAPTKQTCVTATKTCVEDPNGQYASLAACQTACKPKLYVCNCSSNTFSVKPAADYYNNMGLTAGKAAILAESYPNPAQSNRPSNGAYKGFSSESQAEVAAMCNDTIPAYCKLNACQCPTPPAGVVWETTTANSVAAARAKCEAMGKVLVTPNGTAAQTGCPSGTMAKTCYACKTPTACTCADYGLAASRSAACPAGQLGCIPKKVQKTCASGKTLICYDRLENNQCEPKTEVLTRLYGYVVSDPKDTSRLINHGDLQYCKMFGSQVVGNEDETDIDATEGTNNNPLTQADFNVSLSQSGSGTSNANNNPAKDVISAVGFYRFDNLEWNTDEYDITLNINNRYQTENQSLNEGQHGVWICSCPASSTGDPFNCSYKDIPVPSPSNDCVGGDDGMSSTGAYTVGNSENPTNGLNLERLIKNINCYNPAPNFYVTVLDVTHDPWWQASGGLVYGDAGLVSHIPTQSTIANTETNLGGQTNYNKCVPPHCAPYLIRKTCNSVAKEDEPKTSSYPLIQTGEIDLSDNGGETSDNESQKTARGGGNGDTSAESIYYGPREDYDYFLGLLPDSARQSVNNPDEVTSESAFDNCRESITSSSTGNNSTSAKVCHTSGDLTIANTANIEVHAGESYVIFVQGDLNVGSGSDYGMTYNDESLSIKVANGGYLSFIVKKNINIAPQVGYINQNMEYNDNAGGGSLATVGDSDFPKFSGEDPSMKCIDGGYQEVGNIQGVFIASGAINVRSNAKGDSYNSPSFYPSRLASVGSKQCPNGSSYVPDKKFVGEGTFVGWSGVNLDRTFDDGCSFTKAWHDRSPTEVFNYRPDFLKNAPTWMYRSLRLRLENV